MLSTICCLLAGRIDAIAQVAHTSYLNITGTAATLVKPGAGVLNSICVNLAATGETITIFDAITATGTKMGTITLIGGVYPCFTYNVNFVNGLVVSTSVASGDLTVSYQ